MRGDGWRAAPLQFFPADAIVDAELGCLLRLISFAGDRPASWYELSAIGTEPVPPGEFRPETPPGVHVVTETGNPFTDAAAVMPGAAGCAGRMSSLPLRAGAWISFSGSGPNVRSTIQPSDSRSRSRISM